MKKLIAGLVAVLALGVLISLCGCPTVDGRPPEFSVANPCAVPDGSGGTIVAYQVNSGNEVNTYVQRLGAQGDALWGKKGIELGSGSGGLAGSQGDFASLVTDDPGSVTVIYSFDHNIWALKLNMEGKPAWSADRVQISRSEVQMPVYFKAIGDNSSGVITAWASGDNCLCIQRIGDSGNEKWYTELSTTGLDRFDITCDASGNTFVIWKDNPSYSEGNIFAQKVDAEGQVTWLIGGLPLTGMDNLGYVGGKFDGQIIADGEGGAVTIWVQGVLSEDGRKIIGHDLNAQHISNEGETLWSENGVFVAQVAYEPRVVEGASGEMVVLWGDLQNVYAQRLDTAGNFAWPEAGIKIGQAGEHSNVIYYYAESDGKGGLAIVWNYAEGDKKFLRAQRVDTDGNNLWGDNGIKASSVSPYWGGYSTPARISPDGSGGLFVTWAAGEHIKDKTSSYIQRISGDGEILWGEEGIRLDS
jgi:hypothetical protein